MKAPTKICTKCKIPKYSKEFGKSKKNKSGLQPVCKACTGEYIKSRKLIPNVKETYRLRAELYRKNNPESFKIGVKLSTYKKLGIKITKEEYEKLYKLSGGLCQICNNPPNSYKKSLSLDHCHETLKVRGFLCDNCNTALGKFKDNTELLSKAIKYLIKYK
jgi:hypothetical protein